MSIEPKPLPPAGPLPRPSSRADAAKQLRAERIMTPTGVTSVKLASYEFTSNCPRTGQPDFMQVAVEYDPHQHLIESKSFKFYLWSYRDEADFAETIASTIAHDVMAAIEPNAVRVTVTQNPRGGIALEATAEVVHQRTQRPT